MQPGAYALVSGALAIACLSTAAHAAEPRFRMSPVIVRMVDDETAQVGKERFAIDKLGAWNRQHDGLICALTDEGIEGLRKSVALQIDGRAPDDAAVQRLMRAVIDAGCTRVALMAEKAR